MPGKKKVNKPPQLRLRVFAGPNGSGKSTIIKSIRSDKVNGRPIDFGYYINADDIAASLREGKFSFIPFHINVTKPALLEFASASGLLNDGFSFKWLEGAIYIRKNILSMQDTKLVEHVAQLIARYLREALLLAKRRFSFETVFSHPSNLEIMRRAVSAGYKVYLYFVSTESYLINQFRVENRVKEGGHNVPSDKIKDRYYRSLDLMYPAVQIAYQAYVFDNSGESYRLVFHARNIDDEIRLMDDTHKESYPNWFKKYYVSKDS